MTNADTLTVLSYARECAQAMQDDSNFDEIQDALALTDSEIADLYLIDQDDVLVSEDQREAFGVEYRRELLELTLY